MKDINDLPYGIDPREAERFDDVFSDFGEGAAISDEARERILSSVMERMDKDMSKNRSKKGAKRLLIVCIAAAAAATAAISAAALGMRKSREENIRDNLGGEAVTFLEERNISNAQLSGNPHFRVYVDTLLSDGNFCKMLLAFEALDEAAEEQIEYGCLPPSVTMYYGDTGEEISMTGSSNGWDASLTRTNCVYSVLTMPLFRVDVSRPAVLKFNSSGWEFETEGKENKENLAEGVELTVDLSKNVETKILADDSGRELLLSPLGLSGFAPTENWSEFNDVSGHEAALIYEDGRKYVFPASFGKVDYNNEELPLYGYSYVRIYRDELFDIGGCVGARIDGNEFRERTDEQ